MNHYLLSFLALDIARERAREAEQRWLESTLHGYELHVTLGHVRTAPSRATRLRRLAAQLLAAVSRGSAAIVRRLDACVADDLGRTLAPAE